MPERKAELQPNGSALAAKLAHIMGEISAIKRNGWNDYSKFHYFRESDIFDAVRGLLAENLIWIRHEITSSEILTTEKGEVLKVSTRHTIIDAETGEQFIEHWEGFAQETDKGGKRYVTDKSMGAALTYVMKTWLAKTFMLSDNVDDGDGADDTVDIANSAAERKSIGEPVNVRSKPATQRAGAPKNEPTPAPKPAPEQAKPKRPFAPEYIKVLITNNAEKDTHEPTPQKIRQLKGALSALCGTKKESRDTIVKYLTQQESIEDIPTLGQVDAMIAWIKPENGVASEEAFKEAVLILEKFGLTENDLYE